MRCKPALDGINDPSLLLFALLRQVEDLGDAHQVGIEQFAGLGPHPENALVVVAIAIGVFECCLGLPDATQPADSINLLSALAPLVRHQVRCLAGAEEIMQASKK